MQVEVQVEGWAAAMAELEAMPEVLKDELRAALLAAAEAMREQIREALPVASGEARARWGNAAHPDGVWDVSEDGLEIVQGAAREPVEYIERLNAGSSRQAPGGFIEVAVEGFELSVEGGPWLKTRGQADAIGKPTEGAEEVER